jgi:hypothetical protein
MCVCVMPVKRGSSRATISENIRMEMRRGRSHKQAIAIALQAAGVPRKPARKTKTRVARKTKTRVARKTRK